ncbi:MAG TPA: hypothetical protein VK507_09105, partial [Iamia sp.]|nr:hypothetical protein [Iamia sp.]
MDDDRDTTHHWMAVGVAGRAHRRDREATARDARARMVDDVLAADPAAYDAKEVARLAAKDRSAAAVDRQAAADDRGELINALLGDEVFAMGDLPTTRSISILRHGAPGPPETLNEHTLLYHYPLEVLRDLDIVDTPGTNSIERMEEEITR